jgi:hypothetical protein
MSLDRVRGATPQMVIDEIATGAGGAGLRSIVAKGRRRHDSRELGSGLSGQVSALN